MALKENIRKIALDSRIGYQCALSNIEARYHLGDFGDASDALEIIKQLRAEGIPAALLSDNQTIVEHGRFKSLSGWAG